jgi:hypothetical protein
MNHDDAILVRDRLDELAGAAPPVGFDPGQVLARGRRARRRRTQLVVGGTAAALVLVVATPTALLSGRDGTRTAPAASSAAPVPAQSVRVSPTEAKRIARGCALSYAGRNGRVPSKPEAGTSAGRLLQDVAKVYNVVRDGYGTAALLYAPDVIMSCMFDSEHFNASGAITLGGGVPDWLAGPVTVDSTDLISGSIGAGVVIPGNPRLDKGQALMTVGGRVSGAVASVVLRSPTRTVRVTPTNGTYLVRFTVPTPGDSGPGIPQVQVTAYDAAGRSLGRPGEGNCYTAPDGHVVIGVRNKHWPCVPATRWR